MTSRLQQQPAPPLHHSLLCLIIYVTLRTLFYASGYAVSQLLTTMKTYEEWEKEAGEQRRRADEEQKQREEAEKAVAPTDFHTFLSLCYNKLQTTLAIQEDPALSATGTYTNVDSKYYPLCLKPWADFQSLHDQCQARLASLFKGKHVFPPVAGFDAMNDILAMDEPLADENDVRIRQFINVESCARRVLFQYLKERKAELSPDNDTEGGDDREHTALPIRVYFSNAPHGIMLDGPDDSDESQQSDTTPAYKPAMLEAQQKDAEVRGRSAGDGPPPAKRSSLAVRKFHPDQWLMRVNGDGRIMPVFVVEYKAAHKLGGSTLKLALSDTTHEPPGLFAAAIREEMQNKIVQGDERLRDQIRANKATARAITQAFHYMVEFGLCYSYVASGEALILLYFDAVDVRTLYYHLALPQEEVRSGAAQDVGRSAVSLISTMALLALDKPVLSQRWKRDAVRVLKRWPTPYDEIRLLDESSEEEDAGKRKDMPQLAPRQSQQTCKDDTAPQQSPRDNDDSNSDPEFLPPRSLQAPTAPAGRQYATRSSNASNTSNANNASSASNASNANNANNIYYTTYHKALPYCSQACILGLRNGGPLDSDCPNMRLHPSTADGCHRLTVAQFCKQLREQLACDLDENCDALDQFNKFGATGMLFRLTLQGYGYCVVAKGVQRVHGSLLEHETAVYGHLYEQQGTLVPVCLGMIDLVDVYRTSFGAHISHMMVMSYAGERVGAKAAGPMPANIGSLENDVWDRLLQLGVKHGDEREPNLLWDAAQQRLMCIDFELSRIITQKRKYAKETHPAPEPPSACWKTAVPSN